ncbi:DUF2238 domain-containing protein [Pseudomonas sp. QTF5]|uniref:DUF2238 domain-containing protein n=1 Tax=Pseudomonas sp. QTF5 TaxID=1435425 RepID=UPI00211551F9|nr:DUF2238 domain-containing protein [Pseudomonas sp. QTF5]
MSLCGASPGRTTPVRWCPTTSAFYEIVEWRGGQYLGKDTAKAFVAAQNDPWDSQVDTALAVAGAFFTSLVVWFRRRLFHRNAQLNALKKIHEIYRVF